MWRTALWTNRPNPKSSDVLAKDEELLNQKAAPCIMIAIARRNMSAGHLCARYKFRRDRFVPSRWPISRIDVRREGECYAWVVFTRPEWYDAAGGTVMR